MKNLPVGRKQTLKPLLLAVLWFGMSLLSTANDQKLLQPEGNKSVTVYYVSTTGSDLNDGLSWANAFATVQHAINTAFADSGDAEVWVAQGTYYPTECLTDADGLQTTDVFKSFIMYEGVNVYGGFYGNETTNEIGVTGGRQLGVSGDLWDFAYPTILDGSTTSSYHVVWFGSNGFGPFTYSGIEVQIPNSLNSTAIMDGFVIAGGSATMNIKFENTTDSKKKYIHTAGAGVALIGNGELHNCIVENNMSKYGGAGIAMFNGAKVMNCLVSDNEAVGVNFYNGLLDPPLFVTFDYWRTDGAGVVSVGSDTSFCIIEGSKIQNNLGRANDNYPNAPSTASDKFNNGGGIYLIYTILSNSVVSGNNIVNNPSPYDGNSAASCGGGVYMYKNAVLDHCEITDNGFLTSSQNGAGIFIADYTEEATSYDDLVVANCFVHSNRAGGAIATDAQYSTIANTVIANNSGAGIYGYGNCTRSRTVNCLIYNNQSTGWGHTTNTTNKLNSIVNSTIVNNGTGISLGNANSHVVSNCIVWGNNANPSTIGTNASVFYSAFSFTPPPGTGNFQIDNNNLLGPKFESPTTTYGINVPGWDTACWNLQELSPCIDMGDFTLIAPISSVDILGNQRVQGCNVDLGAYETIYGAPEVEFALNSYVVDELSLSVCSNDNIEFTFDNALTGTYPFLVSWLFDNDPGHVLSGTGVLVTSPGQVLFSAILDGGEYHVHVTSVSDSSGCMSIISNIQADILVSPVFSVLQDDHILTAIAEDAAYQWVDCDNGYAILPGETDSIFVAQTNGNFAVIVEQNTCIDTSACFAVTTVNISEDFSKNFSIYPNPNHGKFIFESEVSSDVIVHNSIGAVVYKEFLNSGVHSLDLSYLGAGVYILNVQTHKQKCKFTIIIQ
jgi:hypothetical protein